MTSSNDEKTTTTTTTPLLPDKEQRKVLIQQELDVILKGANNYVQEYLEEDDGFEQEAIEAVTKAANELAYRKKYYDVMNDRLILFPSVTKLIMKNLLQDEAEKYYWEEDDEFPLEYSKCLKTVVKEQGLYKDDDDENNCNDDNDAYMEKLAQDVEI